jgi:hypothetical protein
MRKAFRVRICASGLNVITPESENAIRGFVTTRQVFAHNASEAGQQAIGGLLAEEEVRYLKDSSASPTSLRTEIDEVWEVSWIQCLFTRTPAGFTFCASPDEDQS